MEASPKEVCRLSYRGDWNSDYVNLIERIDHSASPTQVTMANGANEMSSVKGDTDAHLKGVLSVQSLTTDLLSISKLCEEECVAVFYNTNCVITVGAKIHGHFLHHKRDFYRATTRRYYALDPDSNDGHTDKEDNGSIDDDQRGESFRETKPLSDINTPVTHNVEGYPPSAVNEGITKKSRIPNTECCVVSADMRICVLQYVTIGGKRQCDRS